MGPLLLLAVPLAMSAPSAALQAWSGYIEWSGERWYLGRGLGDRGRKDAIRWDGASPPSPQAGEPVWDYASLLQERWARPPRDRWKAPWWRWIARNTHAWGLLPDPRIRRGVRVARLVEARPARWPDEWRRNDVPPPPYSPEPFYGALWEGHSYRAILVHAADGSWALRDLEEPGWEQGKSIRWVNPDALPADAAAPEIMATFRVESVRYKVMMIGVLFEGLDIGLNLAGWEHEVRLLAAGPV